MNHPSQSLTLGSALKVLTLLAFTWGGTVQAQTYMGGIADNFALPTEPASPSTGLQTWLANTYSVTSTRPYDAIVNDKFFATTFSKLTSNGRICEATLRMTVRNGGSNDALWLTSTTANGQLAGPISSQFLANLGVPFPNTGSIVLNLASLPGGINLLPTLNAQGSLDVVVQDDSAVDFISLTITPCRTDVYIKDNTPDNGVEPSSPTVWASPDIRVCQTAGCVGNQNPKFGQINYVYVTLRNTGPHAPLPSGPATGTLRLYRTTSGGGVLWNTTDWVPIGTLPVTVPAANLPTDSVEVVVPWNSVPAPGHYCLLARWDAPVSDPMTFPEAPNSNTVTNTLQNNNLAWRNVNVVDLSKTSPSASFDFRVRNLRTTSVSLADLEVRIPSKASFISRGQVLLRLEPRLWATWRQGGNGFEIVEPGLVRIVNPGGARLVGLQLDPNGAHNVNVSFSAEALDIVEPFEVQLVQYSETDELPGRLTEAGGVSYQITVAPESKK